MTTSTEPTAAQKRKAAQDALKARQQAAAAKPTEQAQAVQEALDGAPGTDANPEPETALTEVPEVPQVEGLPEGVTVGPEGDIFDSRPEPERVTFLGPTDTAELTDEEAQAQLDAAQAELDKVDWSAPLDEAGPDDDDDDDSGDLSDPEAAGDDFAVEPDNRYRINGRLVEELVGHSVPEVNTSGEIRYNTNQPEGQENHPENIDPASMIHGLRPTTTVDGEIGRLTDFLAANFPEELSTDHNYVYGQSAVDVAIRVMTRLATSAPPQAVTRCSEAFCNKPAGHFPTTVHGWVEVAR